MWVSSLRRAPRSKTVNYSMRHALTDDAIRALVVEAFSTYRQRYARLGPVLRWHEDGSAEVAVTLRGVGLRGRLQLRDGEVQVSVPLPRLLRPLEGRARALIDRELSRWTERLHAA